MGRLWHHGGTDRVGTENKPIPRDLKDLHLVSVSERQLVRWRLVTGVEWDPNPDTVTRPPWRELPD